MDKNKLQEWLSKEPSGIYMKVPTAEAKEISTKALDKVFCDHFINIYMKNIGNNYLILDSGLYGRAKQKYEARLKHEARLNEVCRLNNIGKACEKAGDIDGAIAAYEECAKLRYPADHCYERLRIIYKKRKETQKMEKISDLYESSYYDEWEEYCHEISI